MGQRSQIYIRYKNGEKMVAKHLQWNYGHYMINRGYQLLDFIKKNVKDKYNLFTSDNFDKETRELSYGKGEDKNALKSLIEMNLTIGSIVGSCDLLDTEYSDNIKPIQRDNNNGILVIDIQDTKKIKYGFANGTEDIGGFDEFTMCSAKEYYEHCNSLKYNINRAEGEYLKKLQELQAVVDKQIEFIDTNFELLTQEEYQEIFIGEYDKNGNLIVPKF